MPTIVSVVPLGFFSVVVKWAGVFVVSYLMSTVSSLPPLVAVNVLPENLKIRSASGALLKKSSGIGSPPISIPVRTYVPSGLGEPPLDLHRGVFLATTDRERQDAGRSCNDEQGPHGTLLGLLTVSD